MDGKPRLLDQMREQIRLKHYSIRTERVYCEWVRRFIRFHHYRHPLEMGAAEVEAFLSDLAVRRDVSASTQNQALAALLFLYKEVMKVDLPWLEGIVRAKKPVHLPVVLTREEVARVLVELSGVQGLVANLFYPEGMIYTHVLNRGGLAVLRACEKTRALPRTPGDASRRRPIFSQALSPLDR
jgi:integrase